MPPFFPDSKIKSSIVLALSKLKSANAKILLNEVNKTLDEKISLQALYKNLNELIQENVVIKQKGEFVLSLDWANKLFRFFEIVRNGLVSPDHYNNLLERLKRGEKIVIKTDTARKAMQHTINTVSACMHNVKEEDKVINYSYHALFPSESEIKPLMKKGPLPLEMYVYGDTPWDDFMADIMGKMHKKYIRVQNYIPERFYFILGNIIIEKIIDQATFEKIHDFVVSVLSQHLGDFETYEKFKDLEMYTELHIYYDPAKAKVIYERIKKL